MGIVGRMHSVLRAVPAFAAALLLAAPAAAGDVKTHEKRFKIAGDVVDEIAHEIPTAVWKQARCATVLQIGKGGFIVGGTGGWGVVSCRDDRGVWSPPAPLNVGGPTVGAQIGGAKVQVLMVFVDVKDIADVVHATPVFSGSAQATAGPAGVGVAGGANPGLVAGVMSVSKSSGLYAGATWEGLVINPDEDDLHLLYGAATTVKSVLLEPKIEVPAKAKPFTEALSRVGKK